MLRKANYAVKITDSAFSRQLSRRGEKISPPARSHSKKSQYCIVSNDISKKNQQTVTDTFLFHAHLQ
jgi:hypothetical protein